MHSLSLFSPFISPSSVPSLPNGKLHDKWEFPPPVRLAPPTLPLTRLIHLYEMRKSHKKSRLGCQTCKKRKIKVSSTHYLLTCPLLICRVSSSAMRSSPSVETAFDSASAATFLPSLHMSFVLLLLPALDLAVVAVLDPTGPRGPNKSDSRTHRPQEVSKALMGASMFPTWSSSITT